MEIPGLDPGITICKIVVLPIKLYPLGHSYFVFVFVFVLLAIYPKNDLNVHDFHQ